MNANKYESLYKGRRELFEQKYERLLILRGYYVQMRELVRESQRALWDERQLCYLHTQESEAEKQTLREKRLQIRSDLVELRFLIKNLNAELRELD